jgi:uncharacterized protein YkwD
MSLCAHNSVSQEIRSGNFRWLGDSSGDALSHRASPADSRTRRIGSLLDPPDKEDSPRSDWRNHRFTAEGVEACAARLFTILLLVAVVLSSNLMVVHAQPQTASAERALFEAANRERTAQGLAQLRWDDALAQAAREHALLMAQRNTLSHQFAGEPALQDRARTTGARFTEIAENVAEGPSVEEIHSGWMNSPHHRANLLDPQLTAIGIAVVGTALRGGAGMGYGSGGAGMLFAVQDFSQSVASLNFAEQERQVGAALAERGLRVVNLGAGSVISNSSDLQPIASRSNGQGTASVSNAMVSGAKTSDTTAAGANGGSTASGIEDARKTCEMERGWAGGRPGLVVRYESGDLRRLPVELEQQVRSGRYRVAAVGACETGSAGGFSRFRVAVLLY